MHVLAQLIRRYANRGKEARVYFYRDHHGHEIDFLIPVGERLKLIECKWSENPSPSNKNFRELERLIGEERILSKTIITPIRGHYLSHTTGTVIEDSVDLESLST